MTAIPGAYELVQEQFRNAAAVDFSPWPVAIQSAPGRVDVLGGLAAEAGGMVAQMALPRRAAVGIQWRSDGILSFHSRRIGTPAINRVRVPAHELFSEDQLPSPATLWARLPMETRWAAPLLALFYLLVRDGRLPPRSGGSAPPCGATVVIESDIAIAAAQASSTAVATALLQAIMHEVRFSIGTVEKAVLIHDAESLFGFSGGHVVDALTLLCALDGPPAHLLRYRAQPHELLGQITLPPDVRIVALNTGIPATRGGETVRALRLAGAMGRRIIDVIYRDLGRRHAPLHGYLGNLSPGLYRRYFRALLPRRMRGNDFLRTYGEPIPTAGRIDPDRLYRVRTAVDHLISEHEHTENFLQAMEELTEDAAAISAPQRHLILQRAGRLMLASQHSYRLRLGLSCPQADWLIDRLAGAGPERGVYGARITECGGGGTVVALLSSAGQATDVLLDIITEYPRVMNLPLETQMAGARGCAGAQVAA